MAGMTLTTRLAVSRGDNYEALLTVGRVDDELTLSAYRPVNARQTQPAVERR